MARLNSIPRLIHESPMLEGNASRIAANAAFLFVELETFLSLCAVTAETPNRISSEMRPQFFVIKRMTVKKFIWLCQLPQRLF